MRTNKTLLLDAIMEAESQALQVYEQSKNRKDAKNSGIFAAGRYEGLKEALRLLETKGRRKLGSVVSGPPRPVSMARAPFSAIFQKREPQRGSMVLGR